MNYDHIFIITYGRSGSTLLQGVLNSVPGVLIRGENAGALRGLIMSWRLLRKATSFSVKSDSPANPWYGIGDVDVDQYAFALANAFVTNVIRPGPDTKVTGFKEIRYPPPLKPIQEEMEFMRTYFPRAAFIINTRDLSDTIKSNQAAGHGVSPENIIATDNMLRELAREGHNDVFHVHYDMYKDTPEGLRDLFSFLGADFNTDSLIEVLGKEHSISTSLRPRGQGHKDQNIL